MANDHEPLDHRGILENNATLGPQGAIDPKDSGDDDLVFALRDQHHAFSLDMTTVLQCLSLAEQEGAVPELPPDWWNSISNRYRVAR